MGLFVVVFHFFFLLTKRKKKRKAITKKKKRDLLKFIDHWHIDGMAISLRDPFHIAK